MYRILNFILTSLALGVINKVRKNIEASITAKMENTDSQYIAPSIDKNSTQVTTNTANVALPPSTISKVATFLITTFLFGLATSASTFIKANKSNSLHIITQKGRELLSKISVS